VPKKNAVETTAFFSYKTTFMLKQLERLSPITRMGTIDHPAWRWNRPVITPVTRIISRYYNFRHYKPYRRYPNSGYWPWAAPTAMTATIRGSIDSIRKSTQCNDQHKAE